MSALTIPNDATTCNFNDAIQLQDYDATLTPPPTHSEVKIGSNPSTLFGMNITSNDPSPPIFSIVADNGITLASNNETITLNALSQQIINNTSSFVVNSSDYISLTANNDFITITADDNISLTSAGEGNINLDAPNINSYGWALPICLNVFEISSYNYSVGGQALQDVYQFSFNLPNQFFSNVPQSGYTATRWQVNFDMNQFNMSNNSNKAFAMCFELWDSNSNVYSSFLYNQQQPFCRWNNPAAWTNGTYTNFSSVNWCDYIDLGGMAGTFDGNLTLHLFVAGNNPFTSEFKLKFGLTRINRV
ncbi:MAG: hypothetical protein ACRCZ2_14375 [Fusobacteriaceae bacterium]